MKLSFMAIFHFKWKLSSAPASMAALPRAQWWLLPMPA